MRPVDLTELFGRKVGRWTVISEGPRRGATRTLLCLCECGTRRAVVAASLRRGDSRSCGCLHYEELSVYITKRNTKHGMYGTPVYNTWIKMVQRCTDAGFRDYAHYGGRGITVCKRWLTFANFYKDMGDKPSPAHSLDRINNNSGYRKGNCRWATQKEQANNTRSNLVFRFRGKKLTLQQVADSTGIVRSKLVSRLKRGLSIEVAVGLG
jgi:hypothetical protein